MTRVDEHPENYGEAFDPVGEITDGIQEVDGRYEYWRGWIRGYRDAENDASHDEIGVTFDMHRPFFPEGLE